jgi:hypothetical protein
MAWSGGAGLRSTELIAMAMHNPQRAKLRARASSHRVLTIRTEEKGSRKSVWDERQR